MPKPYPILAAALAARGHSLSTVIVAAPNARRAVSPFRERDDWLAGSEHMADVNLESPFATNAFVDRARRIAAALPHSARL